jgi:excisionase family DNA binding protein
VNVLLRAETVAKILDTSRQNVYNLAKSGSIRAVVFKAGGNRWTYRFRAVDVEAFVSGHLREGKPEGAR